MGHIFPFFFSCCSISCQHAIGLRLLFDRTQFSEISATAPKKKKKEELVWLTEDKKTKISIVDSPWIRKVSKLCWDFDYVKAKQKRSITDVVVYVGKACYFA